MERDVGARTALVTGASQGHGRVLAAFLAGRGFALVLTARGAEALAAAAEGLGRFGVPVVALPGDVADGAHRRRLVAAASDLGGLQLLVNNASELGPSPLPPLAAYPLEALRRVLEVNLLAPLALLQEALPLLRRSRGLVVNISSDAAVAGYPGWGGYGASKAALDLATLTLARELAPEGVAVVGVDPGDMRTAMHQAAYPGEDISHRPPPEVTLPFWAWLLGRPPGEVTGRRYRAQGELWEAP